MEVTVYDIEVTYIGLIQTTRLSRIYRIHYGTTLTGYSTLEQDKSSSNHFANSSTGPGTD